MPCAYAHGPLCVRLRGVLAQQIVCVVPLEAVKWTFSMLGLAFSSWFLGANIWPVAAAASTNVALASTVVAVLAQAGLALCFKFVFYTYSG